MLRIGLTGGIGSGKSTVTGIFADFGVPIIDADQIAHQLTLKNGIATLAIIDHFGQTILKENGELNRKKLRHIIFSDKNEKRWLEQLLHPLIRAQMKKQIAHYQAPYCILVIPLLAESNGIDFLDRVLVIDAPLELQIARAQKRDSTTEEHIQAIINSQSKQADRIAIADDVIENDADFSVLKSKVVSLHQHYLKLAEQEGHHGNNQ